MSTEKTFKLWMTILIVLFISLFSYIIVSDLHVPMTTEGRVQSYVVQISPEITGNVVAVHVSNNQRVTKGERLISVERHKFEIALEKAELSLQSAIDQENTLYSQKAAAIANIARAQATFNNADLEYHRIKKLFQQKLVSKAELDNTFASQQVASASLSAEQQNLKVIESQLGSEKGQSTPVKVARNNIAQAKLDLAHTEIIAPSDGIVTNLQVQVGTKAKVDRPLLTFIPTNKMWVTADFREKSLANAQLGSPALVTFDAFPGQVFELTLATRDYGINSVQQNPDGNLARVEVNNRWVRDAQRIRVNFVSEQALSRRLFIGSRATVVIYPQDNSFWSTMAKVQIKLVSWFHYLY